ncbi:hypothetical protein RchiOBHm_Chr4g0401411 [Rosa chinensis]|uniref:Uncharacterized protein n=1 Tax=Rosa chinensis TaxID=74649 RepID=A0A2P6QT25_ROSCH|nr:hypothetical protein RchiOBHm_Chr4g0401411 [Rosa chinensis]
MQHFLDLQDNPTHFADPKWESNSSPTHHHLTQSSSATNANANANANANLDRVLFQDLIEIIPLVQSLILSPPKSSSQFLKIQALISNFQSGNSGSESQQLMHAPWFGHLHQDAFQRLLIQKSKIFY